MMAENMDVFQSEMNDLREVQGFDPNSSLNLDQSIVKTGSEIIEPNQNLDDMEFGNSKQKQMNLKKSKSNTSPIKTRGKKEPHSALPRLEMDEDQAN
jgi:hypothetical protein